MSPDELQRIQIENLKLQAANYSQNAKQRQYAAMGGIASVLLGLLLFATSREKTVPVLLILGGGVTTMVVKYLQNQAGSAWAASQTK